MRLRHLRVVGDALSTACIFIGGAVVVVCILFVAVLTWPVRAAWPDRPAEEENDSEL